MDVTIVVKSIGETVQVSEKFKKRILTGVENSSQYPQVLEFQATQSKTSILDSIAVGDTVKVFFNLRGREWTSPTGEVKVFVTLEAWRLEKESAGAAPSAGVTSQDDDSGLPF